METKWYVIRAVNGKEKKAKEQLEFEIKSKGFADKVKQLVIPIEKVYHVRNGKKVFVERNHYPGYILIETEPNIIGELSGLHKIINFVIGFLGGNNPQPLKPEEVSRMLGKIDELTSIGEQLLNSFDIGENITVIDGPFNGFNGSIKEVLKDKNRLKIDIKIFGRSTPIELDFSQVSKVY